MQLLRVAALSSFLFTAISTQAQTSTWTGGGGNVNWSTAGNWGGTAPLSSTTTDLIFAGTTNTGTAGTPLNQDINSPMILNSLSFSSGGGSFFLGGNPIRFAGSSNTITQNSSSAESIANAIEPDPSFGANTTITINLAGSGTGVVTLSGTILDGNGQSGYAINKTGSSTFVLSGASTYKGGTTVNAGALFINNTTGSGTGTGAVTVNGGTLGGSGTISGAVTVASGANLSPGATGAGSTAVLRTGNLTLSSGSNFILDLNNTTVGTGYDQLSVTGTVNITGSNLVLNPGAGLSVGNQFFIVANDLVDPVIGTFNGLANGATFTVGNDVFLINYAANFDGGALANDISLTLVAILPEPPTWIAGIVAFAALGCDLRRRLKA